jgi:hypothetical protein
LTFAQLIAACARIGGSVCAGYEFVAANQPPEFIPPSQSQHSNRSTEIMGTMTTLFGGGSSKDISSKSQVIGKATDATVISP